MCYAKVSANTYWQKRRLISEPFPKLQAEAPVTSQHTCLQGGRFISLQGGIDRLMEYVFLFSRSLSALHWYVFANNSASQVHLEVVVLILYIFHVTPTEWILFVERLRRPKVAFNALLTFRQVSTFLFGSSCINVRSHRSLGWWSACPRGA